MAFGIANATGYFLLSVNAATDKCLKFGVGLFLEFDELFDAHQLVVQLNHLLPNGECLVTDSLPRICEQRENGLRGFF